MRYAGFTYRHPGTNLGDVLQSIAAERFLPRIKKRFRRDRLHQVREEDNYLLIMNGNFHQYAETWPPSESIVPVFFGFRVAGMLRDEIEKTGKFIDYFKRHEPIGCRDKPAMEFFLERGVSAYYSKCLTLTFPKRESEPKKGKVIFTDVDFDCRKEPFPRHLTKGAIRLSHNGRTHLSDVIKFGLARYLLTKYKGEARLVITQKLHCALPCLAMGIPLIFFAPRDMSKNEAERLSLLEDLGVKMNSYSTPSREIDWDPKPIDLEAEKRSMIERVKAVIKLKEELRQ